MDYDCFLVDDNFALSVAIDFFVFLQRSGPLSYHSWNKHVCFNPFAHYACNIWY